MSRPPDPYAKAARLQAAHRRRVLGWAARWGPWLAGGVAILAIIPLFEPVFFAWMGRPRAAWPGFAAGLATRMAWLLVGLAALEVHAALVRDPARAVLDLLPVDPARVARRSLQSVLVGGAWLPLAAWAMWWPFARAGEWAALAAVGAVLLGAWAVGVAAAGAVTLLAVEAAEHPRWAPLLDALRGQNPREQAAFIYAPGLVLGTVGLLFGAAAGGVGRVMLGDPTGWALVLAPWLVVPPLVRWGAGLAERYWARAASVLADIDARHAAVSPSEDARAVYLDGLVRWLPGAWRAWALRDLRQGWRSRRAWVLGGWGVGVAGALAGWSAGAAPLDVLAIGVPGLLGVGAVGVLLDRDTPELLAAWLPDGGLARRGARVATLGLWLAPGVLLPPSALAIRQGLGSASFALGGLFVAASLAVVLGMLAGAARLGLPGYAVAAAIGGGALAVAAGGL